MGGFKYMWQLIGAANVYMPKKNSFEVFLDKVYITAMVPYHCNAITAMLLGMLC
jgi:hypothetical protein